MQSNNFSVKIKPLVKDIYILISNRYIWFIISLKQIYITSCFFLILLSVWWHCICGILSVDYKELNILAQRLKKRCYYRDTHILLLFNNAMILYRLINGKRWKSSFHKYCWYRTNYVTVWFGSCCSIISFLCRVV